jgi:predicted nucleic acid-binding protein
VLVIDASAALPWIFLDEASQASDRLFERVAREGAKVPSLFHLELANALVQAEKRKRLTVAYSSNRLEIIAELPLSVDLETASRAWFHTVLLARQEELTVYDASYLELALRSELPIATLDQRLAEAARRRGVEVIA